MSYYKTEFEKELERQKEHEEQIKKIIQQIDSSLEYVEMLNPSSVCTCLTIKRDSYFVLKFAEYYQSISWMTQEDNSEEIFGYQIKEMISERNLLEKAKEVEGITHLMQVYPDVDEHHKKPILKEYFEGANLYRLNKKISDRRMQQKLERTINELHDLGFAELDIKPMNIVLSPRQDDVRIIEVGGACTKSEVGIRQYDILVKEDLERLEKYIFE